MWNVGVTTCRRFCTYEAATIPCPGNNKVCIDAFGDQPAGVCLGNNCTPPAEGCSEGQKCAIANNEVWACMPAGDVAVGDDCSVDWCMAGAQCGYGSICQTLCDTTDDCADGTHCVWVGIDTIPEWGLCEAGCDLVSQLGCSPGADSACTMMDSEDGATDCFAPGDVAVGEDCSGSGDLCVPGAECLSIASSWVCSAYCDAAHPCASGSCQAYGLWFPEAGE